MAIRYDSFQVEENKNYLAYVRNVYGEDAKIIKIEQVKKRTLDSVGIIKIFVCFDDYKDKSDVNDNKINFKANDDNLLNNINNKIDYLMNMRWKELASYRNNLDIPPEFTFIYEKAKTSGMLQSHLEEIMVSTFKNMPKEFLNNKEAISVYFKTLLKNMIICKDILESKSQKIIMLVGPTGVGKTTTLAKLAHRYAYNNRYKTAVINLDNFRLGARSQLDEYVNIMKLPIRYANNSNELQNSIEILSEYDIILIDSTGNSQNDKIKLEKLENYLINTKFNINVSLVLSAGMKYDDLYEIFKAFDVLNIDNFIFTKFDETKTFGNVFSLVFNTKKPLSFFSIGQNVPDDIVIANSDYLTDCILNGFKG